MSSNNYLAQRAIKAIKRASEFDPESAHEEADKALCDLLKLLGFADVVEEWEKVEKWYA